MPSTFRRPELYVPLSVRFLTGETGTRLLEKFGRDGPLVWAAFLTACKLERPQGELVWASEPEAWMKLGLTGYEPDFSFDQFLEFTGRLKLTRRRNVRKTRTGRVQHVGITVWGRWTDVARTETERTRKARKRAESPQDKHRTPTRTRFRQHPDLEPEPEEETGTSPSKEVKDQPGASKNGTLDVRTELLLAKLLTWIGNDADTRTAAVVRHALSQSSEAAQTELEAALTTARPRHRAKYVVGTLKQATARGRSG